jgi:hypothetical protein
MAVTWATLGVAGLSLSVTLVCGALAGFIAQQIAEAWWLRREHRRDVANGYTPGHANGEA